MKICQLSTFLITSLILCACDSGDTPIEFNTENVSAAVTAVSFIDEPNGYTFRVSIESPDTGCEQYADWWEVLRPNGTLVYRRILTHSHVNEQPFTRSGGLVIVAVDEEIFVRAHMNNIGYGEQVFKGSIEQGFTIDTLNFSAFSELAIEDPLPDTCAF